MLKTIGFRYKETNYANSVGLDEISPIVELADEFIIRGFKNGSVYASSQASRPNPHNIITAIELKVDDQKEFRLSLNYNIKDKDHSSGVGAEYKPNDNLNLYINVYNFGGASNTHFGQYRKNRNIEIGLKKSF